MVRARTFVALSLVLLAPAFSAQAEEKEPSPEQIEKLVHQALLANAPAIDRCLAAYSDEFPKEVGKVVLDTVVAKDGSIAAATASTTLTGSRNLRPCLERAAKGWRLPPPANEEKLSLTLIVKKGAKFTLKKPGEPEAPNNERPQPGDEGFLQFLPSSWGEGAK
jgi:hypothetical protein